MLWRGRIYSPLPFVRSLLGRALNTGIWGTAAFPSVYRTASQPFAFLPHSAAWHVLSALALVVGFGLLVSDRTAGRGLAARAPGRGGHRHHRFTLLRYARSRIFAASRPSGAFPHACPAFRCAWRSRGCTCSSRSPACAGASADVVAATLPAVEPVIRVSLADPVPGLRDGWAALRLMAGASAERSFWSERWLAVDDLLSDCRWPCGLPRLPAIDIDDGWNGGRDCRWRSAAGHGWISTRSSRSTRWAASSCGSGRRCDRRLDLVVTVAAFAIILAAATKPLFTALAVRDRGGAHRRRPGVCAAGVWRTAQRRPSSARRHRSRHAGRRSRCRSSANARDCGSSPITWSGATGTFGAGQPVRRRARPGRRLAAPRGLSDRAAAAAAPGDAGSRGDARAGLSGAATRPRRGAKR